MIQTFTAFTGGFHEAGSQVENWVMSRSRGCFSRDEVARAAVNTPERLAARRRGVRDRLLESIDGLPYVPVGLDASAPVRPPLLRT